MTVHKKKRISAKRIFSAVFALLFVCLSCAPILEGIPVAADDLPTVSFTSGKMTIAGSTAKATVTLDKAAASPVTVHYHTENLSAVAGVDYKAASGSVTITDMSSYIYVALINTSAPYSTSSESTTYCREFVVVIDSVEGAKLDTGASKTVCSISGKMNIPITITSGLAYADVYAKLASTSSDEWCIDDDSTKIWNTMFGDQTTSWGEYVKNGLADAYTTFTISDMDHSISSANTKVYFWLQNSAGTDLLYFKDETCARGGYRLNSDELYTVVTTQHLGHSYGDKWLDLYDINVSTTYKYLYTTKLVGGPESIYLKVPLDGSTVNTKLKIKNTASYYHIYYTAKHYMRLVDDKAPTVTGVYLDDSALSSTGKLRLSVRFSEPVRSKSTQYSCITLQFQKKDGTYEKNDYTFYYAGGNYTDTLYYECDIPAGLSIYGFRIASGGGDSKVVDLSYVVNSASAATANSCSSWPTGTLYKLEKPIIYVKPSISVEGGYGTKFATQVELVIKTGTENCTVYTLWDKSPMDVTDPQKYETSDLFTDTYGTITFGDDSYGDGDWYLHVMAVNAYGQKDVYTSPTPYKIDRTSPTLSYTIDEDDICYKKFTISAADSLSGLSKLEILIDGVPYTIYEKTKNNEEYLDSDRVRMNNGDYVYSSRINEGDNVFIDRRILDIMEAESTNRRTFTIAFRATDTAEGPTGSNVTTTENFFVTYDTRDKFAVSMTLNDKDVGEYSDIMNGAVRAPVYNIDTDPLLYNEETKVMIQPLATDLLILVDGEIEGTHELEDTKLWIIDENGNRHEGNQPIVLAPGYHELTPIAEGADFTLVSNTIRFYLTDGMTEDTPNAVTASGNILLTNEVFRLSGVSFTYLKGSENPTVQTSPYGATYDTATGRYTGGSSTPTFSSISAASSYVRTTEYQDLYLVKLDETQASFMVNGTSTVYAYADDETVKAQAGQLWIRYKRKTWTQYSDANGGWAYYFYAYSGEVEKGINVNKLPENLKNAISEVTKYILKAGETVYLVGDAEISAATGAPYLPESQMHVTKEYFTETRCGSKLEPNVSFAADNEIYHNTVSVGEKEYPLATNLTLKAKADTILFVKDGDAFVPLPLEAGKEETLRNLLIKAKGSDVGSGLCTIREIDNTGVRDFTVYVDTAAPKLSVSIYTPGEHEGEVNVSDTDLVPGTGTVSGVKISFTGFKDEIDPEAYVAVYTFSQQKLLATYYADALYDGVTLESSNYYVEIGDRSGNRFSFPVILSDSKLETEIKENDTGTSFSVRVLNRTVEEIYRYEVHFNGENLEVDKDKLLEKGDIFKTAGVYSIFIQDIYGNSHTEDYIFNYKVPEVFWYSQNSSGEYVRYTGSEEPSTEPAGMTLDTIGDLNYTITTATTLRFFISDKSGTPAFSITGISAGDYTVNRNARVRIKNADTGDYDSYTGTTVEIKELSGFSVAIYYEEHPENVKNYTCSLDTQAPSMDASYIAVTYKRDELAAMDAAAASADPSEIGDMVIPPYITYSKNNGTTRSLNNGDTFSGSFITLSFHDASGIFSVKILRDGVDTGFDKNNMPITLNEYGRYDVTVYDNLGNKATYFFINESPESGSFLSDGKETAGGTGTTIYGHDTLQMTTLSCCESEILVKAGGESYYFRYLVDEGTILQAYYEYAGDSEGYAKGKEDLELSVQSVVLTTPLLSLGDGNAAGSFFSLLGDHYENLLFDLPEGEELNFDILASLDARGNATFTLVLKDGTVEAEMRSFAENGKTPAYAKCELSDELSDVPVRANGNEIVLPHDGATVHVTKDLTVFPRQTKEEILDVDEKITKVEIFSSTDREVWTCERLYTAGESQPSTFSVTEEGFYRLEITNRYGNVTVVEFSLAGTFLSTSLVRYRDGMEQNYNNGEDTVTTVTSNDSVTVFAYNPYVTFTVNGVPTEVQNEQDVLSITFTYNDENTEYLVVMTDLAGNVKTVRVVIGTDPGFVLSESWLTGYTEGALRKSEGYTSDKLSVVLPDGAGIAVVTVTKDGEAPVIVYNTQGSTPVTDASLLSDCVGLSGDGVYTVTFRNIYGDAADKVVHFRQTPTLSLSRITSFSGTEEAYDLSLALSSGFLSNRTLIFSTCAETYEFRIGGSVVSLASPKIVEFTSTSGEGTIPYEVTYVDEYGMTYAFEATLMRKNSLVDTAHLDPKTVDGALYTAKDVSFTLPDGVSALVSVNGGEKTDYTSGTVFRADAKYGFTFVDFAGNVQTFTVTHDSVAHFSILDRSGETDVAVINGGAVNAKSVTFVPDEDDTSFILRAFLDGTERTDTDSNVFSQTGHWELLISDAVGNVTFFEFDLLNHPLAEYHFEAPYGYTISEVWRTDADGNKQLTSGLTSDGNRKLDLTFRDGETGPLSYAVILISEFDNDAVNFTVQLDNTPPTAQLVGVEDGGDTPYEVTLTDVVGNTVEVYRDGNLVSSVYVEMQSDIPVITEGGKYEIRIKNPAGVVQTLNFSKRHIANAAASVLMIVACLSVAVGMFIGLLLHHRSKTDD